MAGLALCVTDLPEMAGWSAQYDLGVTFRSVEPGESPAAINAVDPAQIDAFKRNALAAARELCWEREARSSSPRTMRPSEQRQASSGGRLKCVAFGLRSVFSPIPRISRSSPIAGPTAPAGRSSTAAGPVALGHRRLSIIDLSDAAQQPMSYADGRYWVVYNGEIYNYLELREELRAAGHSFRTRSDTEVLLAALAQWGEAALDRLVGMFAFVLWDQERADRSLRRATISG